MYAQKEYTSSRMNTVSELLNGNNPLNDTEGNHLQEKSTPVNMYITFYHSKQASTTAHFTAEVQPPIFLQTAPHFPSDALWYFFEEHSWSAVEEDMTLESFVETMLKPVADLPVDFLKPLKDGKRPNI